MDADYVCSLNDDDVRRARKELNEDPRNRLGAVRKLREWIEEQPHITFSTDTRILLLYLRYAKFSQLKARETIERNCLLKTHEWKLFEDYNPKDEWSMKLLKPGCYVILPGRGDKGQMRLIVRMAAFDPAVWKHHTKDVMKAVFTLFNYLIMEEAFQVCGIEFILDYTGVTVSHQTLLSLSEWKTVSAHLSHTLAIRIKAMHVYNAGSIGETILALMRTFMSKKLQRRFVMHGSNLESLYKHIPKEHLPQEYLPDDYTGPHAGTIQSLTDELVEKITRPDVCDYFARLTDPCWKIDMSKKPTDQSLKQSFRKLSVF